MENKITSLIVCINRRPAGFRPSCAAQGSEGLADRIEAAILTRGIAIRVERICCLGHCQQGPTMRFAPGGEFFLGVSESDLPRILERAIDLCGMRPAGDEETPPLPPPGS